MRRRNSRYANLVAPKKEKLYHELDLLNSRILVALKHFMDYKEEQLGAEMLGRVFHDYRNKKEEVKRAVISTMKFLFKGRYKQSTVDPAYKCQSKKPTKDIINDTKRLINQVARKIWQKK